jgi:hypothetical protein
VGSQAAKHKLGLTPWQEKTVNYSSVLSNEQIQHYAPSAFAAQPYAAQSSRYAFIPTVNVIDGMRAAGFLPVMASQSRTRIADKREFTKHMIRFRSASSIGQAAIVGDSVLEAVLINSHDGSSAYKLMAGVFRFVCSNGMVVADSLLESIHVRHTGNVIEEVISGTTHLLEQAPTVQDTIRQWGSIQLSQPEQRLLAEQAHSLRFPIDEETGNSNTAITRIICLPRAARMTAATTSGIHLTGSKRMQLKGLKRSITARAAAPVPALSRGLTRMSSLTARCGLCRKEWQS